MSTHRIMLGAIVCFALAPAAVHAQWLNYPTPGIPRLPDGKPNLAGPAPRTADGKLDLQGIWMEECAIDAGANCTGQRGARPSLFFDLARDLPPGAVQTTPWAAAIQAERVRRDHVDDPFGYCLPMGVPRMTVSTPFKILVTPRLTAFLHETTTGLVFRQVFTDGRPLPTVTEPTWLGYSIGHWEGDTFVVESTGFKDRGRLDTRLGRPHSDVKPWTTRANLRLLADTELLESFCEGHDRTMEHRRIGSPSAEPPSPPLR